MRRLCLMLFLLLLVGVDLGAQTRLADLRAGDRVRVTASQVHEGKLIGRVLTIDSDSLALAPSDPGERVTLPITSLEAVEISTGRDRSGRAQIGALIGLVGGVGLGLICVAVCPTEPGGGANMAPVGGFIYGPAVGAIVGAASAPERWRKLPQVRVH